MPDPLQASIMEDFRQALGVKSSPSFFESLTPITPVAVVGGNLGFPKPRANQRLRSTTIKLGGTGTNYQISTVSATQKVYFLGYSAQQDSTAAHAIQIYDNTSGSGPSLSANTAYADEQGYIANVVLSTTSTETKVFSLPMPIELKKGLRVTGGAASVQSFIIVYFIEETVLF